MLNIDGTVLNPSIKSRWESVREFIKNTDHRMFTGTQESFYLIACLLVDLDERFKKLEEKDVG